MFSNLIVRREGLLWLGLLIFCGACAPSVTIRRLAPAPYNLGPAKKLVLAAANGPTDRETGLVRVAFIEQIDEQGFFDIEDAVPAREDLFDFFERLFSKEKSSRANDAEEFRRAHPADVYVRLYVTEVKSWRRTDTKTSKDKDGKETKKVSYWAEANCGFQVTLIDGRDGTRFARFTVARQALSATYDDWSEDLRHDAETSAVNAAVEEALKQFTPRRISERLTLDEKAPRAAEGIDLIKSDKLREARLLWEQAAKEGPGAAGLAYNLGCVCEALGDTTAAAKWYEDAIRLDPASERNRSAAEDLQRRLADAERLRQRD
jgi:tetratricopeptide (TPR) repeat protein